MLIIIKDQTKRIEFSIEVEKYLTRNGHEVVRVKSNDSKADIHFKLRTPITDTNEYEKLITKVNKDGLTKKDMRLNNRTKIRR